MRYQLSAVSRHDRSIVALRRAAVLMIFFVLMAAVQVAWDGEVLEKTIWTFGACFIFVLVFVVFEVWGAAPTGYFEIGSGVLTQRYNEVEKVILLSDVTQATMVNVLGNKGIVLKIGEKRCNFEYGQYHAGAIEAIQAAFGPSLKRGSIIDHLKSILLEDCRSCVEVIPPKKF